MKFAPSQEEYERWRDDRVTQWIFRILLDGAEISKATWMQSSWEGKQVNPLYLKELRVRADVYNEVVTSPYETWLGASGDEEPK